MQAGGAELHLGPCPHGIFFFFSIVPSEKRVSAVADGRPEKKCSAAHWAHLVENLSSFQKGAVDITGVLFNQSIM